MNETYDDDAAYREQLRQLDEQAMEDHDLFIAKHKADQEELYRKYGEMLESSNIKNPKQFISVLLGICRDKIAQDKKGATL